MPPPLALLLTTGFIATLLWRERRTNPHLSPALWIPIVWFFIVGSKFVSQWLSLFGLPLGDPAQVDGSPVDAVCFFLLIVAGAAVLIHRRVELSRFVRNNKWLTLFLAYSFLAILWSDFPLVASKRWVKTLAHPIMALVILTDPSPEEALRAVFRRTGYVLFPLSVLFIKYYPQYGRGFDSWTGKAVNVGINNNKNELGYVCMIFGLFFVWNVLAPRALPSKTERRQEMAISLIFIWMIWWLLSMADSATSLGCLLVGAATFAILGTPLVNRRFVGTYIIVAVLVVAAAQMTFGAYDQAVALLGRNTTLTDRTAVWQDVLEMDSSPVLGAGFESFWLGDRLDRMWAKWWWHPIQAHNGYIETYLNLGWIGVVLLIGLLLATFRKGCRALVDDFALGRFRLGTLFAIIVYNYTEATFKAVHLVWTAFYLIAIDYAAEQPAEIMPLSRRGAARPERRAEPKAAALAASKY